MVSDKVFTANGITKIYSIDFLIISDNHCNVFIDAVLQSGSTYDIINNAIVFNTAPATGLTLTIQVGTTADDLLISPTEAGTVAANITNVNTVAGISGNVTTVAGMTTNITAVLADAVDIGTVATNIASVNTVATNITSVNDVSANMTGVLTAVTWASNAATSATAAQSSEDDAATDLGLTNADVVLTHADVVLTAADVVSAEADKVQTGLDRVATAADVVLAEADKVQTALDRIATAADKVATNADVVLTAADVVLAEADRVSSAASASTATTQSALATTNGAAQVTLATAQVALATTAKTAAETAETNAETAETNASSSASSATTAQAAAESARDSALASFDSFDDRYLGQKSSAPTLDNDGNALVGGTLYFNSTSDTMYVYEGSAWVAAYASLSGALLQTNNLSDLNSAGTARTNLGVDAAGTVNYTHPANHAISVTTGLQTALDGKLPKAGGTMTGDVSLGDNVKAKFGAGNDLQIYHNGSNSIIEDTGSGDLIIKGATNIYMQSATGENYLRANSNGGVTSYYDNNIKLATTSTGIDVTGSVTCDGETITTTTDSDSTFTLTSSASANNTQLRLGTNGNDSVISGSGGSTGALAFKVYGTERLRIDSAGNVGIGTSSPSEKLVVIGNVRAGSNVTPTSTIQNSTVLKSMQIFSTAGQSAGRGGAIELGGFYDNGASTTTVFGAVGGLKEADASGVESGYLSLQTNSAGTITERMRIDSAGNVGIGTDSPTGILSIPATDTTTKPQIRFQTGAGTTLADAAISTTDDSGGTSLLIGSNQYYSGGSITRFTTSRSGTAINFGYTGRMKFYTGSGSSAPTERMQIDSAGNVGIGTSSPVVGTNQTSLTIKAASYPNLTLQYSSGLSTGAFTGDSTGVALQAYGSRVFTVRTNSAERMRITSAGNVGIGTSSPSAKLEVNGELRFTANNQRITWGGNRALEGNTAGTLLSLAEGYTNTYIAGNVGIGTTSPSEKLYVSGNIYATGNVTAYSDERIKENINVVPNALDAVDAIRGVTYTRTDTKEDGVGVIAQEVEALFPELVVENNEGMKSVNYNGLVGVLFAAVKELSAEVKLLKESK